jgi:hypothetical protein
MNGFDFALKLSRIASDLDDEKDNLDAPNDLITVFVEDCHSLAQKLAGNRVSEIYFLDDAS